MNKVHTVKDTNIETEKSIIAFWFNETKPAAWFEKNTTFDQQIRQRFLDTYYAAAQCELSAWREQPLGRLAEIITLDQFPRNIFRNKAQAFATDSLALALSQEAIRTGADKQLSCTQKSFLYMPFMHSESKHIHSQAEQLFKQPGMETNYNFELRHKKIIDQFGRYPHRNTILMRESSNEELAFLNTPGSSF